MFDKTLLAYIAVFGAVWTVAQFYLKHHFEQLKARRESGAVFLAEVSQCIAKARFQTKCDIDCVSFESYSKFIIHLSFEDAKELLGCWDDYIETRSKENVSENELSDALNCLFSNIICYTEPFSIFSWLKERAKRLIARLPHSMHKLFGSVNNCSTCISKPTKPQMPENWRESGVNFLPLTASRQHPIYGAKSPRALAY